MNKQKCTFFVGVQGAGKETHFRARYNLPKPKKLPPNYICLDKFTKEANGDVRSGAVAMRVAVEHHIENGISFFYETTILKEDLTKRILDNGFSINVYYIYVHPIEKALDRIEKRVSEKGHDIKGINVEKVKDILHRSLDSIRSCISACERIFFVNNSIDAGEKNVGFISQTVAEFSCGKLKPYKKHLIELPEVSNLLEELSC